MLRKVTAKSTSLKTLLHMWHFILWNLYAKTYLHQHIQSCDIRNCGMGLHNLTESSSGSFDVKKLLSSTLSISFLISHGKADDYGVTL